MYIFMGGTVYNFVFASMFSCMYIIIMGIDVNKGINDPLINFFFANLSLRANAAIIFIERFCAIITCCLETLHSRHEPR